MINVMVTYTVKPDRVEENERLVRAVYEGLAAIGDPDVHYATFKKEDGLTFVHLAFFANADKQAILSTSPAFVEFQRDILDRCDVPPQAQPLSPVGWWSFPAAG